MSMVLAVRQETLVDGRHTVGKPEELPLSVFSQSHMLMSPTNGSKQTISVGSPIFLITSAILMAEPPSMLPNSTT